MKVRIKNGKEEDAIKENIIDINNTGIIKIVPKIL